MGLIGIVAGVAGALVGAAAGIAGALLGVVLALLGCLVGVAPVVFPVILIVLGLIWLVKGSNQRHAAEVRAGGGPAPPHRA